MAGGQLRWKSPAKTWDSLIAQTRPLSADYPEVIPFSLYDTQALATNWTAVNFFGAVNNNKGLGNISQPNTLPAEQFLEIHLISFELFQPAPLTTLVFAQDVAAIYYTASPVVTFQLADKTYGQYPLTHLNPPGGVTYLPATGNAVDMAQPVVGAIGAGQWVNGAISIPPKQTFTVNMTAVAAALGVTRNGRFAFHGNLYRRVL